MENLFVSTALIQALDGMMLNLSHFYLMKLAHENRYEPISRVHNQTLERKGWLVAGQLTETGTILYNTLLAEQQQGQPNEAISEVVEEVKEALKGQKEADKQAWDLFWKAYPTTSTWFTGDGRRIDGGRSLKQPSKDKCEPAFMECLRRVRKEGKGVEDMIAALEYEVNERKRVSAIRGTNEMNYQRMIGTWLNQRAYEGLWESMAFEQEKRPTSAMQKIKESVKINNNFL